MTLALKFFLWFEAVLERAQLGTRLVSSQLYD
jgi:hypothetical protein